MKTAVLTFFVLLPVVLGANPYRRFLKDATFCQEKDAVCKMSSGYYGCCPAADGVCCADGDHCCPSGFKCDLSAKQCLQYGDPALYVLTEDMLDVAPIGRRGIRAITKGVEEAFRMQNSVAADTSNVCPNGHFQCPDDMTCCPTRDPYTYSCCPEKDAVCCSTGMYCCPAGFECNNDKGTCVKNTLEIAASSTEKRERLEIVICPDRRSQCPNRNTCCKLTDGNYACCPLVDAVCCSDQKHCCPHGYSCDVKTASCTPQLYTQLSNKKPVIPLEIEQVQSLERNITCPDHTSQCPYKDTCCLVSADVYGCCPQQNATCCADKKHCCPHGYICDKPTSTCMKAGVEEKVVPLQELVIKTPTAVHCPDGGHCPDGNTCCLNGQDTYGCCPVPNAMCCSDHKSCCPEGYTCDVQSGTCTKKTVVKSSRFIELVKSSLSNNVNKVVCPGNQQECPDDNTCCVTKTGGYGCCPVPNANCCDDHMHCCPSGYTCDVTRSTCTKSSLDCDKETCPKTNLIKLVKHVEDNIKHGEIVICPDGSHFCPNGNTCCINNSGGYGCCPVPNAVCCEDRVHCCPSGYTCDVANGTCTKSSLDCDKEICPKTDLIKLVKHVEDNIKHGEIVICPDGSHFCPNGNTCCINNSGGYGCCPVPNAVCCEDRVHCCPSGYTCDVANGTCTKSSLDCDKETCPIIKANLIKHVKHIEDNIKYKDITCPNYFQTCPYGDTCCANYGGGYSCCPDPNAVCCSDYIHCCPSGYTCDVTLGTCIKLSLDCDKGTCPIIKADLIKRVKHVKDDIKHQEVVYCPGGVQYCSNGETCCLDPSGEYGCCPISYAVCCYDGIHCCPIGYICISSEGCIKASLDGLHRIPFLVKSPTARRL